MNIDRLCLKYIACQLKTKKSALFFLLSVLLSCRGVIAETISIENLIEDCDNCHTVSDVGTTIPIIAGQDEGYLYARMIYFKKEDFSLSIMSRLLQGYSYRELSLMADQLAQQRSSLFYMDKTTRKGSRGYGIYHEHCSECHSNKGAAPLILGQSRGYIVNSLRDFLFNGRAMPEVMRKQLLELDESEMMVLINYMASPR